jgi:hypothetical protein
MKKKSNILKKILCLTLAINIFLFSPIGSFIQGKNAYVYANTYSTISDDLLEQILIPLLISAGLVFNATSGIDDTVYKLEDWLYDLGLDYEMPEDPEDPDGPKITLSNVMATLATSKVIYNTVTGTFNKIVDIPDGFFDLVKNWVDSVFDPDTYYDYSSIGFHNITSLPFENVTIDDVDYTYFKYDVDSVPVYFYNEEFELLSGVEASTSGYDLILYKNTIKTYSFYSSGYLDSYIKLIVDSDVYYYVPLCCYYTDNVITGFSSKLLLEGGKYVEYGSSKIPYYYNNERIEDSTTIDFTSTTTIDGDTSIIDNTDYDWNNPYTDDKIIVLPIETDTDGTPEVDSDGYHKPSVTTQDWVDVTTTEVTEADPTGVDEPEEDEDTLTTILSYIKSIFRLDQAENTDSTNDTSTSTDGTDDSGGDDDDIVATDFDWGDDFPKFFKIFYIFIYFIAILILLLVKMLYLVFFSLTAIEANTALFDSYPTILEAITYVQNLTVGGLTITVQEVFEYVFTIFFFIFIIKQIRKLYDSFVYEEHERIRSETGIKSTENNENHNDNYKSHNNNVIFEDHRNDLDLKHRRH